jgi:hypothetical protein
MMMRIRFFVVHRLRVLLDSLTIIHHHSLQEKGSVLFILFSIWAMGRWRWKITRNYSASTHITFAR